VVDAAATRAELPEEDDEIRRDQAVRDDREPAGGGEVEEREDRRNLRGSDLTGTRSGFILPS
jgi:hypothetical protein